jgi:DNA modification methylase
LSEIVNRKIADLAPYERNARTHSPEQITQIADSIREFGFTNPVLVTDDGMIVAGHGRVEAAKIVGCEEVPTLTVGADWSPDKVRAYVLADNKLALNSGWDEAILRAELADLKEIGFDIALIGFSVPDLADMFAEKESGKTPPDYIPEIAEPVSVTGDVWLLGNHRIACGDATDAETVAKALGGATPHLMVTDPPYGVGYDPEWRTNAGVNKRSQKVATGKVENDDKADWREAWALFPGDVAYVWHGGLHAATVSDSLAAADFVVRSQIIWAKQSLVIGRGHYHWQHEPCWYAVRKGGTGHWAGDRKQSTIWQIANMHRSQGNVDDGKTVHGTQKPVECMRRPMENNSKPGDAVYEPFSGSGTTIIAAEMTGRHCCAVELNPAYVDLAVRRWQEFTGKDAVLESSGETFAVTLAGRAEASAPL